jgi:NAD(P)-dependent dehydrogenase (short-subunit alcohol dehydrogenase family)
MAEPNERTVLVTGAGRGIGRAIARRFAAAGWRVVATVRDDGAEAALREELRDAALLVERCDLADRASVAALAKRLRARIERLDVLINNAAIFEAEDYVTPADRIDAEMLRRTLDVNVVGTVAITVALLPLVPRGGRVVSLSSDLGQFGKPGGMTATMVAYSISKAAVNAYTAALANALHGREIRVDSIHPGWVRTAMGGASAPRSPEEGAAAVYALATREGGESGRFWRDGAPAAW